MTIAPKRDRAANGRAKPLRSSGTNKLSASYDAFKEHQGKRYTGMKVGRGHKWRYAAGEWKETKVTPDKWEFHYEVPKRRAGKAPEGSGAPVGTAYHWYILAHQTVTKLDANSYSTEMDGVKYKLAHKRADKGDWSAKSKAQCRRLIAILREVIAELEAEAERSAPARATTPRAAARTKSPARKTTNGTRARKPSKAAAAKVASSDAGLKAA
jgi:hypothetical protein